MRTRFTIFMFSFVIIFVMATGRVPSIFIENESDGDEKDSTFLKLDSLDYLTQKLDTADSARFKLDELDSIYVPDDVFAINPLDTMDSLHKAIYLRNLAIDDSIKQDSAYRKRKNGIDAPVQYVANDSMIYYGSTKTAHLFGESNVKYEDMDLTSEKVYMSLDSSLVHATGVRDSSEEGGGMLVGTPIFKMGSDTYESDTMAFNFKTKKGLIRNVYTAQDDAFMISEKSKRDKDGNLYLMHGRYTTCDEEHPDFYIALSRAKVRPGKDVVFGPAYLVVQDVPLPLAIPYGFFPFSKSYSSGFIMPTYGDEMTRGFYLRDGGYYFAISDQMDLKALGEIYTKGSWGVSAASNYRKRYRYNGSFYFSYQDSRDGDKGIDETRSTSFRLQWRHSQDSKANPYSRLSASVNFETSNYEANNLNSLYNPQSRAQNTRTSSVSYSTGFSSIGMTMDLSTNFMQRMSDSTISVLLPSLNMSISRFYPFRRKNVVGDERWYEKISMSYTGSFSNSITTKEDKLMNSSLIKDWKNGLQHSIPISATFSLFKYINVTPSVNISDKMYSHHFERSWDQEKQREVVDTIWGFSNVYDWRMSLDMSTTVYGMFVPNRKIFGEKLQAVRHMMTPRVSFSYAPDFSDRSYGFYGTYMKTDKYGNVTQEVIYDKFAGTLYGGASSGKTGRIGFTLGNNIEAKIKDKNDSIRKISIIDKFDLSMSYNMAAKVRPWSDLSIDAHFKIGAFDFPINAVFATYAYELDENGRPYVGTHTEYSKGRFGRWQGMSKNISYTLTPDKLLKLFGKGKDKKKGGKTDDDDDDETDLDVNGDKDLKKGQNGARKENAGKAETDADGYMKFALPWSLSFSYGVTIRENTAGTFNKEKMRYPYAISQNLNFSGNIRLSDGWNIAFSSGYDFDYKKLTMTTASLSRDLHCFNMSCQMVLLPYTSYNFSFRCNAATLTDALKYDKRSGYSNSVKWY